MILWNPNRHVILSAGLCLVIGVGFYACVLGCKSLGDADYITPPLAAWLPVMLFGPLALVSFDHAYLRDSETVTNFWQQGCQGCQLCGLIGNLLVRTAARLPTIEPQWYHTVDDFA